MQAELDQQVADAQKAADEARAKYLAEVEERRAWADNAKEGPGLRRGPPKQKSSRPRRSEESDDDEGEEEAKGPNGETLGWGGFPVVQDQLEEQSTAELEQSQLSEYLGLPFESS
jgi:hypothetical protein